MDVAGWPGPFDGASAPPDGLNRASNAVVASSTSADAGVAVTTSGRSPTSTSIAAGATTVVDAPGSSDCTGIGASVDVISAASSAADTTTRYVPAPLDPTTASTSPNGGGPKAMASTSGWASTTARASSSSPAATSSAATSSTDAGRPSAKSATIAGGKRSRTVAGSSAGTVRRAGTAAAP